MSLSRRRFLSLSGAAMAYAASRSLGCLPPPVETTELVEGNNAFALDLYSQLKSEKGNLFLSPFSISTALAMTSAGGRGNTLAEMTKTLHLPADPHPAFGELLAKWGGVGLDRERHYELTMANAIWAQKGFAWRDEFKEIMKSNYGTGLVETDFGKSEAARTAINGWVENATKQKIKELIPKGVIDALTRMVLTNAVYFKGDWAAQFKKELTKDQPFRRDDGAKATVPLMEQTGEFGYAEIGYTLENLSAPKAQMLELPYAGKHLSMLLLLPEPGDLAALEGSLSDFQLKWWMKALAPRKVQVHLPRFKVEMEKPLFLNAPLQSLGMNDAFDDLKADFSGLQSDKAPLYISHVLHKAFVDVNEEGTEAAAATGVVIAERAIRRNPVFRADRPFLFLIRENKSGGILFLGRYAGPKT